MCEHDDLNVNYGRVNNKYSEGSFQKVKFHSDLVKKI